MLLLGFVAGVACTLALIILLLPWLRTIPKLGSLPQLHWQAGAGALAVLCATAAMYGWQHQPAAPVAAATPESVAAASSRPLGSSSVKEWADVADALQVGSVAPASAPDASKPAAQSMTAAVASLEARLARGGGSADDWELLAKSYEFLGRAADAGKARAHQLPATSEAPSALAAASLNGEVSLANALRDQAPAGATVFIIAKSIDSPGAPVAVLRSVVTRWPLKFHLDDSLAMLPSRTLSGAGRVTVEARISRTGQPLAGPGDLQGATGPINPADHAPLAITIDQVIR